MVARIQPLLPDGILAANTLPQYFEFARRPTAHAAAGMIDLHWTDVPGAARCELWTRCAAAITATTRRYPEGRQALPGRELSVDAAWVTPNASTWRISQGHTMTKLIDVAIFLIGLLAAVYTWPVSKALTFVVVGSLYGFLVWRIFSNAKREKKTHQ